MKLCVALDMEKKEQNLALANELKGFDIWLKVGLRSYLRDGMVLIDELRKIDKFKIFLDLKIYDIPNTMADACEVLAKSGVDMISIHASSGKTAMYTVMDRLNGLTYRPKVLAVSALTSFSTSEFYDVYNVDIKAGVEEMSKTASWCGVDGMICSAHESAFIKSIVDDKFITLCPGIRPFKGGSLDDQKRVADIEFAKNHKVDFIVVGRPIYKDADPKGAAKRILSQI